MNGFASLPNDTHKVGVTSTVLPGRQREVGGTDVKISHQARCHWPVALARVTVTGSTVGSEHKEPRLGFPYSGSPAPRASSIGTHDKPTIRQIPKIFSSWIELLLEKAVATMIQVIPTGNRRRNALETIQRALAGSDIQPPNCFSSPTTSKSHPWFRLRAQISRIWLVSNFALETSIPQRERRRSHRCGVKNTLRTPAQVRVARARKTPVSQKYARSPRRLTSQALC